MEYPDLLYHLKYHDKWISGKVGVAYEIKPNLSNMFTFENRVYTKLNVVGTQGYHHT